MIKIIRRYKSIPAILCIFLCIIFLGKFAQIETLESFHGSRQAYRYSAELTDENKIDGSSEVIDQLVDLRSLVVEFEFINQEPTFSYGNLFQTGDSSNSMRMELQPPNNLILVLGDGVLYPISKSIQVGKIYNVSLMYEKGKAFKAFVDKDEVLNLNGDILNKVRFDISDIAIGTGYSKQRALIGSITNFSIDGTYICISKLVQVIRLILVALCVAAFVWSLRNRKLTKGLDIENYKLLSSGLIDNTVVYGVFLTFMAVTLLVVLSMGNERLGLSKWGVHLSLPLAYVFVLSVSDHTFKAINKLRLVFSMVFILYSLYLLIAVCNRFYEYSFAVYCVVVISIYGFLISISGIRRNPCLVTRKYCLKGSFLFAVICAIFLIISWISLVGLSNWNSFLISIDNGFAVTVVGAFLVLRGAILLVFDSSSESKINYDYLLVRIKEKYFSYWLLVDIISLGLLFVISFRYDSLFVPGSEYHWEYFVGVVQTIRNGGWLLWDTPSQYGFLNIILASIIPTESAWQAFYIFQGILLSIVSMSLYLTVICNTARACCQRLVVFAIIFMSMFFADPDLIGPYPFPSSSVVRFFFVYIFVLSIFVFPKYGSRQALILATIWSFSVIWSAESAVYGTAIYLFVYFGLLFQAIRSKLDITLIYKYVFLAILSLSIVLSTIYLFYLIRLEYAPDYFAYFEHAVGYAQGFGYVPFPLSGPANILLFVFIGVLILFFNAIKQSAYDSDRCIAPLAALAGCIWGVSTYYIGRPVSQNVTAIVPIIMMVTMLALILSNRTGQVIYTLPIRAIALPLIFITIIPVFNPNWIDNLIRIRTFTSSVIEGLPKASVDLQKLISQYSPSPEALMVYYGDDAAPPIFFGKFAQFNEKNWLPIPLQLLEVPVSEVRRTQYLQRYICRKRLDDVLLINKKNELINARLSGFLRELNKYYIIDEVRSDANYALYHFNIRKEGSGCVADVAEKRS